MIRKLNEDVDIQKLEQRIDDVINDVKDLYESSGRLNDAFIQNKSDGSNAYEKVILKLLSCTNMLSPIWYRIHHCLKETFPDYRMPKIGESKSSTRRTSSDRHLIENNNLTRAERINLIINIIKDLENKDLDGITDSIVDIRNNNYESATLKESVYDGYLSYLMTYFENDDDGYDFVEKYYDDDTDTFYEELESACEEYVSTFSADVIESFFDYDDPLNPGDMDSWINGTSRFTYKPHSYEFY